MSEDGRYNGITFKKLFSSVLFKYLYVGDDLRGCWTGRRSLYLLCAACICCLLIWYRYLLSASSVSLLTTMECESVTGPAISADTRGRLGNNLAEYATIYALGIRYNMTAVATPSLLRLMAAVFPNTTMPVVSDDCAARHQLVYIERFVELSDEVRRAASWKIDYYPHRIRLFWQYREELKREFTFRRDLAEYADKLLRDVAGDRQNLTFVGVHVRRTDYAEHLRIVADGALVNESFYHSALALCRERYHRPIFIITSDDLEWCRVHLMAPDVYLLGDPRGVSPGVERDLALLAACNHTIFDYGTFGFFAAFFAGGDMILADGYSEKEHAVIKELRLGGIQATFLDANGHLLPKCVHCQ